MTTPKPPVHVEILVDGKRIHSFLAERLTSSEDRESLSLEAVAWHPELCTLPPNPALPDLGVAAALVETPAGNALPNRVHARQFAVAGGRPLSEDEKTTLAHTIDKMTEIVRTVDQIVNATAHQGVRGTCLECALGEHTCTETACHCTNPHRCAWHRTSMTTEGN